jgi:UDP-GlcNAc:undecaprenyl-phosphate GlcNAc-1-phosphate transferase
MFTNLFPESYQRYLDYLPLFLTSFVISLFLTPLVGYIARKLKIVANPPSMRDGSKPSDYRHLEKPPTPLLGGVAVLIPLIIMSLIHTELTPILTYFLVSVGIILLGGIIDDKFEISYRQQIFFHILAATLIVLSPINLTFINNPFNGALNLNWIEISQQLGSIPLEIILPGDLILFGWVIICINAVKWVSGTDGLMEGDSFFSSVTLFILSLRIQSHTAASLSIIFGGLTLGFLFYNFYPARIRSGSAGKTAYGFILAVLSVMSGAKIAVGIIILMIPLLDFIWVIIGRIKQHKPKSLSALMRISDQTHLHHKLLKLGLTEPQVALLEYFMSAVLGAVALFISGAMNAFAWFATSIGGLLVLFIISRLLQRKSKNHTKDKDASPESKYSY